METMVEPTSLILNALAIGAVATSEAVNSTYMDLKMLIQRKFAGKSKEEAALADYANDPETYKLPLKKALLQEHVDQDEEIIKEAQRLMNLLHQSTELFQKKYALIKLLDSWREEGDENEQKGTWEYLKQSLDEDRLSERKLFP